MCMPSVRVMRSAPQLFAVELRMSLVTHCRTRISERPDPIYMKFGSILMNKRDTPLAILSNSTVKKISVTALAADVPK